MDVVYMYMGCSQDNPIWYGGIGWTGGIGGDATGYKQDINSLTCAVL